MAFRHATAFVDSSLNEPLQSVVIFQGTPNCFTALLSYCQGTKYRITSRGVEMKKGVCCKVVDNVELWRVKDTRFVQSGLDGCCSTGTIILYSDELAEFQEPEYRIVGVSQDVYARIRQVLEQAKHIPQSELSLSSELYDESIILSEDTLVSTPKVQKMI